MKTNCYGLVNSFFGPKEIKTPLTAYFFKKVTVPAHVFYAMQDSQRKMGFVPMQEIE